MAFGTAKLNSAVSDFKKLSDPHWQLYRYGQFYVTNRTVDDLFAQIETELKSNIRFQLEPEKLPGAVAFFRSKLNVPIMRVAVPLILAELDLIELRGDMATIKAMFKPTTSDRANAQSEFNDLWSSNAVPTAPLWTGTASLPKAQAAFGIEKDRCWQVLRSYARMLLRKKGLVGLPAATQISTAQLAGAFVQDAGSGRQVVRYASQPDLMAAVAKIKAVVDAGGFVHCGLLSGAKHDKSKFPQPEHHVLVFGYDTLGGQDAFVFWDPDASGSNIASAPWGRGFGVLFSRPGRLCTGIDDADLAGIDVDPTSDTFGDHKTEPRRHCYQVYTLQSLPLPAVVKVHTKVIAAPVHSSVDEMLDKATWLYAAYGVELHESSREVIDSGTDLDRYRILVVGDPVTAEVSALHAALRDRRGEFGVEPAANEAVAVFVEDLLPAARGSAVSPAEQPGIVLSAAAAGDWTLAHEIGHLVGLGHTGGDGRLMAASVEGVEAPELTADEVQALLASPLVEA